MHTRNTLGNQIGKTTTARCLQGGGTAMTVRTIRDRNVVTTHGLWSTPFTTHGASVMSFSNPRQFVELEPNAVADGLMKVVVRNVLTGATANEQDN